MNRAAETPQTPSLPAGTINVRRIGLALSGGGVRAAVFHTGVLTRLAQEKLSVSTVSDTPTA